ncbi:MAG: universal stress protein [Gammaproteobacteria bacterium]
MFKRILIPTDGSPTALKAARAGVALAKALGARVIACHVVEGLEPVFRARAMVSQRMIDDVNRANRAAGQEYVDAIGKIAAKSGVPFNAVVVRSRPPHVAIVNVAKKHKCDVIFIATHGRGGFSKLMLGSVAQKVVTHANLPVLVYR